jgi:hypothetical protein
MPKRGVPLALSEESSLTWANDATDYCDYFCARCGLSMQIDQDNSEFRHPQCHYCSDIQSVQQSALLYLKQILDQRPRRPVQARLSCRTCNRLTMIDLSHGLSDCNIVRSGDNRSGLLLDGVHKILIYMRPASKAQLDETRKFDAIGIEVDARNVLSGTPIQILSGPIAQIYCEPCKQTATPTLRRIAALSERFGITYDTAHFKARPAQCWNCSEAILVFLWKEDQGRERQEPWEPRPHTVQRRWSESHQTFFWVNTCPSCDRVQGDSYIFDRYFGFWY